MEKFLLTFPFPQPCARQWARIPRHHPTQDRLIKFGKLLLEWTQRRAHATDVNVALHHLANHVAMLPLAEQLDQPRDLELDHVPRTHVRALLFAVKALRTQLGHIWTAPQNAQWSKLEHELEQCPAVVRGRREAREIPQLEAPTETLTETQKTAHRIGVKLNSWH